MNEKLLEKIELFNVGELRAHPMGWLLARYPEWVCAGLSSLGAYIGSHACGCEIRFVRENPDDAVDVTLLCVNAPGSIVVMQGDFWVEKIEFAPGELKTITIRNSPILQEENEAFFAENCFSRNVTRLICSVAEFVLCEVRTNGKEIRPPEREDLPKYTCLAYGSSITQGAGDIATPLSYIAQAARMLDSQALNKGLGGSCFMEACAADWLAQLPYDYMIFEAGTNMYDDYAPEEIERRGSYLLCRVMQTHPEQYVFLPEPPMLFRRKQGGERYARFVEAVRKIQECAQSRKCVWIPNEKLQPESFYVSADRIHPSPFGHVLMGADLAAAIRPYLEGENV